MKGFTDLLKKLINLYARYLVGILGSITMNNHELD
jgi:hypothetical protein